MDALRTLPRADQKMLRPPPVNLIGKGASKGENEVEANSSAGQGTNPHSELVQEGVDEGPLK